MSFLLPSKLQSSCLLLQVTHRQDRNLLNVDVSYLYIHSLAFGSKDWWKSSWLSLLLSTGTDSREMIIWEDFKSTG